jgi:HSP20 family protein
MKKDEIDIQLNGDTLTLRGERQIEQSQKDEQYHRVERQYGAWQRSFQIEIPIDAQKVSADYESGVLTVRLPKAEEIKPRQIEIKS